MAKRKNRKVTAKKIRKTEITLTANRKYKDTVFRMLFSDRKNLLSLYNAINGTAYENADDLEIVTLENAISMGMKNDPASALGGAILAGGDSVSCGREGLLQMHP